MSTEPNELEDYRTSAIIGQNITICGMPPKHRLVTFDSEPCFNCQSARVLRRFSGSGWYEDDYLCLDCGEDVATRYRPFKRAWRKANIKRAEEWLPDFVEREMYFRHTQRIIADEMNWDDDARDSSDLWCSHHEAPGSCPVDGCAHHSTDL